MNPTREILREDHKRIGDGNWENLFYLPSTIKYNRRQPIYTKTALPFSEDALMTFLLPPVVPPQSEVQRRREQAQPRTTPSTHSFATNAIELENVMMEIGLGTYIYTFIHIHILYT